MSARMVWKGLAIVDARGQVATWRGSETPKLFHSEEQSRHHRRKTFTPGGPHSKYCGECRS